MNRLFKKLLSGIITALMVFCIAVIPSSAEISEDDLLVNITFDEDGTSGTSFTATKGGTVTKHGSISIVDSFDEEQGKAMYISSKSASNYLSLADGILQGKQAATFSFWVKATSDANPNWPFMNTCEESHTVNKEKYLGMLVNSSNMTAERYNNTDSRLSSVSAASTNEWQYITAVFESGGTRVYQNGKLVASDTAQVNVPALFTASSHTWIGHANWGSGEGFQGYIDDFKIYGKALTNAEVKVDAAKAISIEAEKIAAEKNRLEIETKFFTNDERSFEVVGNDVKVNVPTSSSRKVNIIGAAYTNKTLANVVMLKNTDILAGMNSFTLEGVKKNSDDEVKVFIWDSESEIEPVPDISVNNVFQISEGSSVTVKTKVTNSTTTAKTVKFGITEYLSGGKDPIEISIDDDTKTVDVIDSDEFSYTIIGSADAEGYQITVTDITDSENPVFHSSGFLPKANVSFPDATPQDTTATTFAAHDPSIFKDPKTGIYYAYNSGNAYVGQYTDDKGNVKRDDADIDCFRSADLIHWERIDCNFRNPESAKTHINTIFAGRNSVPNDQSWAPDILYVESDKEHPYWLYYSLSTTGTDAYVRSVIGLVKGASPTGPWTDCGVVISSEKGYNTNAIDSNIYTDTNGDRYLVWGSYQRGIHQLKLREDGLAEGIDYSSIQSIHSSSKTGTRLFSTPDGTQGPEGPWMINNTDTNYRYMFVSCGWLATTYNVRVARNSLDKTWASETSSSAHHKLLDHMGRKVGTTFTEQTDKSTLWGYKVIGSYQLGDGLTYYGNGHNSVLHDDDDNWYLVEHCRKQMGGYANLQVRKMLWNEDGWPVVSPLVYAGEKEQEIPMQMIAGTWDLSSVGRTILDSSITSVGSGSDEKVDMPVLSSKLIFALDNGVYKQDGACVGEWSYDGDHTVTVEFIEGGDEDNYEFYQDGDTMTLYVLTGYDKDKRESALVMTGTDQNNVTQFAKKDNAVDYPTRVMTLRDTTPVSVTKSTAGNPILGFDGSGNTLYAGDPAAMVEGDTVYLFAGHDTSTSEGYKMPEWVCYSSKNMTDWTYEGVTMKATDISWRNDDTSAWASQVIKHGNKYYMYFCTWDKNSSGKQSIGVATSDSPTGPFVDKGTPLVKGTLTEPETSGWNDIDPTVWVETVDGVEHRYLAWGNGILYVCELNEDMISVKDLNGDSQIKMNDDIKQQTFTNLPDGLTFTEAPWIYRRTDADGNYTGKYYMFGAFGWREQMGYATSDTMYGPWEWGGVLMPPTATSNTNHPSVIDFKGKTYFIYHNGSLPWGSGFRRVVCVEKFDFNEDGSIDPIKETASGLTPSDGVCELITISFDGAYGTTGDHVYHEKFDNSSNDSDYPLKKQIYASKDVSVTDILSVDKWRITQGKADSENENYVSIEANDKPGLYICTSGTKVILTQQDTLNRSLARKMTFKTVEGLAGGAVSFESVANPGYFLTSENGVLTLSDGSDPAACTFLLSWLIGDAPTE